jgi:hypothetical protein
LARRKDVARVDIALAEAEVAESERRLADDIATDVYHVLIVDQQIASRKSLTGIQSVLAKTTRVCTAISASLDIFLLNENNYHIDSHLQKGLL